MSPARKVDPALLEREYVYDSATPPVSITQLADNHGMARSHIADMARRNKWYEKRKEVRLTIGSKVLDAMTDRWAETQTIIRDRMLEVAVKMLDQAEAALAAGEIKISRVADVATILATMRVLLGDQAVDEARKNGPTIIDMEAVAMDPAKMAEMLPLLKQLAARTEEVSDDDIDAISGHARTYAPPGPAGTEQD
jgi:hypothetical protein